MALLAHLPFVADPVYGDEAIQYTMSRNWGMQESRAEEIFTHQHTPYGHVFWQRPLFPVILSPGSAFGFLGMRIEMILLTSLLAPLGFGILQAMNVERPWALLAGATLAVFPTFSLWGARIFPDPLCVVFVAAALLAHQHQRHVAAAGLLVAGAWIKEVALPAAALLGLVALLRADTNLGFAVRRGWRATTPYICAFLVGAIPLAYVLSQGARLPGWSIGTNYADMGPRLFVALWTVPFLLFAAYGARRDALPWLALVYPTFLFAYLSGRGAVIEAWYFPFTNAFVYLALGLSAHLLTKRFLRAPDPRTLKARRALPVAVGALMLVSLLMQPPLTERPFIIASSADTSPYVLLTQEAYRGDGPIMQVADLLEQEHPEGLLLMDLGWFNLDFPLGEHANVVGYIYTQATQDSNFSNQERIDEWLQRPGYLGVLHRFAGRPELSHRIDEAYAACQLLDVGKYVVIRGADCDNATSTRPVD